MEVAEEHTFHHFSHQHPLEHTVAPSIGNINCEGCSLRILPGKDYYNCKICSFFLHRACSNMPRKTRHPAHPDQYLTLLVSPPSDNSNFKCEACGFYITGFSYNVAESSIYYHFLCSALPLSVMTSAHPHTLNLEFSPPYDCSCDLCLKPSFKGWTYRCGFCEFDTHIACAISNQKAEPVTPPDALTRQIIYSSALIMEADQKIDYGSESNELMQLIVQRVERNNTRNTQEAVSTAVAGWDKRLRSPREHHNVKDSRIGRFGMSYSEPYMPKTSPSPGQRSLYKDQSTPTSDDVTISSYQFSEMCFSIDLLKSYPSTHHHPHSTNMEAGSQDIKDVPEVEAKIKSDNVAVPQGVQQLDYPNKPVTNPLYRGPTDWYNDAFLGQTGEKITENGYGSRAGIKDQSPNSNMVMHDFSELYLADEFKVFMLLEASSLLLSFKI
ncbi:unnamed protein product [Dovyalis caffra]|uniref:DC1 domain-containing protein n=1 Tax=Dovyalis caffra TaxID=77055 RepID=A0AAV1S0J8_9ROSI|nr:unnamed protein product [Dovyalis caffra]